MVVLKKLQWVCGVVMIDLLIIVGWCVGVLCVSQWVGFDEWLLLVVVMCNWCMCWMSCDEVWWYFCEKFVFVCWDEWMLVDYIDYGILQVGVDGECVFVFDWQVEYLIYWMLLYMFGLWFVYGVLVLFGFFVGMCLCEVWQVGFDVMCCVMWGCIEWFEGSYLFLMEWLIEIVCVLQWMLNLLKVDEGGVLQVGVLFVKCV